MGDLMPVPVGIAQKLIPTQQHWFKVQTQTKQQQQHFGIK